MTQFNLPFVKDLGLQKEVMDALPYAVVGGAWEASFEAAMTGTEYRTWLNHIVPARLGCQQKHLDRVQFQFPGEDDLFCCDLHLAIAIKIFGEMKIAAKEIVFARELKLNTIQVLLLTAETGLHYPFTPQKWIYHKGEYDNYASIDLFAPSAAFQYEGGTDGKSSELSPPSYLPHDGSIWLNFIALGE